MSGHEWVVTSGCLPAQSIYLSMLHGASDCMDADAKINPDMMARTVDYLTAPYHTVSGNGPPLIPNRSLRFSNPETCVDIEVLANQSPQYGGSVSQ